MVVHAKVMCAAFTCFVVYGMSSPLVDLSAVTVAQREFDELSSAEINLRIRSALGRKLVVVGATIGTDAHTVGIDAILNVKGHAGEKGLEYYREIKVVNLGSQVEFPAGRHRHGGGRRRGPGQPGRHAEGRAHQEHSRALGSVRGRWRPATGADHRRSQI
jgi:hypothetical protein